MKFLILFLISLNVFGYEVNVFEKKYRNYIIKDMNVKVKQKEFKRLEKIKIGIIESKSKMTDSAYFQLQYDNHALHISGIIQSLSYSDISIEYYHPNTYQRAISMHRNKLYDDEVFLESSLEMKRLKPMDNPFLSKNNDFIVKLNMFLKNNNVDIVNLSSGLLLKKEDYNRFENIIEKNLIKKHKNIIFICAAGNENKKVGKNYLFLPASHKLKNIISVTMLDKGKITGNYGDVDFGIQAKDIRSEGLYSMINLTGSSQASAIMTSAVSRIKERYPDITLKQVIHILKINSIKKEGLKYGEFSYESFNRWMNKDFYVYKINQKRYYKNYKLFLKHANEGILFI